ncbi:Uncharacterized protein TPAR_01915, partial [Tolypocladium paradoxum]
PESHGTWSGFDASLRRQRAFYLPYFSTHGSDIYSTALGSLRAVGSCQSSTGYGAASTCFAPDSTILCASAHNLHLATLPLPEPTTCLPPSTPSTNPGAMARRRLPPALSGNELFGRLPLEVRGIIWRYVLEEDDAIKPLPLSSTGNMFRTAAQNIRGDISFRHTVKCVTGTCRLFWEDQQALHTFYMFNRFSLQSHESLTYYVAAITPDRRASLTHLIIDSQLYRFYSWMDVQHRNFLVVLRQCTNLQVLHYKGILMCLLTGNNELESKKSDTEVWLGQWVINLIRAVQRLREVRIEGQLAPTYRHDHSYKFFYDVKSSGYKFEWEVYQGDEGPWPSDRGKKQLDLAWNALRNPDSHHEGIDQKDLRDAYEATRLRIFGEGRSDIANNPFFVSSRTRSQHHTITKTENAPNPCSSPRRMGLLRQSWFDKLRQGSDSEVIEIHFVGFKAGIAVWVRLDSLLDPDAPDSETQCFVARLCDKMRYWCKRDPGKLTVHPRLFIEPVKELAWGDHALERKYVKQLKRLGVRFDKVLLERWLATVTKTASEGLAETQAER